MVYRKVTIVVVAALLGVLLLSDNRRLQGAPAPPQRSGSARQCDDGGNLLWEGGGVRGPNATTLWERAQHIFDRYATLCASGRSGEIACASFLLNITSDILHELDTDNGDCVAVLPAFHRAACLAYALTVRDSAHAHDSRLASIPLFEQTLCYDLFLCLRWRTGRFSRRLSAEMLESVYRTQVLPAIRHEEPNHVLLRRLFIHGEVGAVVQTPSCSQNDQRGGCEDVTGGNLMNLDESHWLFRRSLAQQHHHEKITGIHAAMRHRPLMLNAKNDTATPRHISQTLRRPTDLRPVFRGRRIGSAQTRQGRHIPLVYSDDKEDQLLEHIQYLTPLQLLSALHHIVTSDEFERSKWRQIVAFGGDSVNRELFLTLIDSIRQPPRRQTTRRSPSPIDFPERRDMVYVVFATHDELLHFDSPVSNRSGTNTVEKFLVEKLSESNSCRTCPHPLLVVVWYWDPFTYAPRRVLQLVPPLNYSSGMLSERCGNGGATTSECQHSISELNVSAAVIVHGAMFWERRIGPPILRSFTRAALYAMDKNESNQALTRHGHLFLLTSVGHNALIPLLRHLEPPFSFPYINDASSKELAELDALAQLSPECRSFRKLIDPRHEHHLAKFDPYFKPDASVLLPADAADIVLCNSSCFVATATTIASSMVSFFPPHMCFSSPHVHRNILLFQWLNNTINTRRSRVAKFVASSVALLDKSKAQFIPGFTAGDQRHFSCHGVVIPSSWREKRNASLRGTQKAPTTWQHLLEPLRLLHLIAPIRGARDGKFHQEKKWWPDEALHSGWPLTLESFLLREQVDELMHLADAIVRAATQTLQAHEISSLPVDSLLPLEVSIESNGIDGRCHNDGDNFLLQLMMRDVVLKT